MKNIPIWEPKDNVVFSFCSFVPYWARGSNKSTKWCAGGSNSILKTNNIILGRTIPPQQTCQFAAKNATHFGPKLDLVGFDGNIAKWEPGGAPPKRYSINALSEVCGKPPAAWLHNLGRMLAQALGSRSATSKLTDCLPISSRDYG